MFMDQAQTMNVITMYCKQVPIKLKIEKKKEMSKE